MPHTSDAAIKRSTTAALTLGAIGVVYGDIGTSPLYTIKEIFATHTGVALTQANILGAISSVFWALMLVVTLKYVLLVLRADNKGEGGIMALLALALSSVNAASPTRKWLMLIGVFGAALFYGDSILTPAISVLSAVEGLQIAAPALADYVLPISVTILIALFALQRYGTSVVGGAFGPIIIVWFTVLGAIGIWHISQTPGILAALNPMYAFQFLTDRGPGVFLAVGAIVLAITGAEALYADMGHFGRPAIRIAWTGLVLPGLALNYLGQGALLLRKPEAVSNPFYLSFPEPLLIPAVILATLATIIASQAVISGAYSVTRQAMQLGFLPRMRIVQTSAAESGQIYMPAINWLLLLGVIIVTVNFGSSSALATAYGIAVTGTMLITTLLTFFVIRHGWRYPLWLAASATGFFMLLDGMLLASTSVKFLQGGWFPVALSLVLLLIMWTWKQGRQMLLQRIKQDDPKLEDFIAHLGRSGVRRVERTAVFLVSDPSSAPQALMHNLKHNQVLHQTNLLVTVLFDDVPQVPARERAQVSALAQGFWQITLRYGFMDRPDIPQALGALQLSGVEIDLFATSYFISREVVVPIADGQMAKWRENLFALMSRNASSVVEYFNIPLNSVIELGSRVHI
ncbi:potassium transporter Kup [Pseudomethylobacillus aquaticus]|uniref:Probable potassium transport system protein Kup n=1 Tax=Pseudomethylobacillus aquaticus TaxID=2676064 RepID=A0A3N0UVG8_9PROT|nr:potassium transporter Kup [Pseudomethylobacillus aquaticus]ROH84453.1 potassium transporter Kup [Pseudomethylobacillus aquaticus]